MTNICLGSRLRNAVSRKSPLAEICDTVDLVLTNCDEKKSVSFLRMAVNRAIQLYYTLALSSILQKCRDVNPAILERLVKNSKRPILVYAVQFGNIDATKLLLEFGADPNGNELNLFNSPLRAATLSPRQQLSCTVETLQFNVKCNGVHCKSVSYEIIRLLLEYGADPLLHMFDRHGTIPIHNICHLAALCPDAAMLLVKSTGANGFSCRYAWPPGSVSGSCLSPLSLTLFNLSRSPHLSQKSKQNILVGAIIPMILSGAILLPDPLESEEELINLLSLDSTMNPSICSPFQQFFAWLILQARWSGNITKRNMAVFHQIITNERDELKENTASLFSKYPLRLDHLCRTTILRHLPVGFYPRQSAIKSLQLPQILENFLCFSDLNAVQF